MKKNVVHFITGLKTGGAELMLLKLLSVSNQSKTNLLVISLMDKGTIGRRIEELGIRVFELNLSRKSPITLNLFKLWSELNKFNPDIFQGWMYHANFLSYVVSWFYPRVQNYWGIRQSLYNIKNEKLITRIIINLCKYLSYHCDKVIFNSKKSLEQHICYGFYNKNCMVIPNGFDVELFSPSKYRMNRSELRRKIGIPDSEIVVGIVARYHPMKGYENFIKVALNILNIHPNICFVAAGNDVTNDKLGYLIDDKYKSSFYLLGERHDIPQLLSIFDISVSSSIWGEAFSNSLCEAMAMEIPCIVTDVGDSKYIVGKHGLVVKPGDIKSLSSALFKMIEMNPEERNEMARKSRVRIVNNFSLKSVNYKYSILYDIQYP